MGTFSDRIRGLAVGASVVLFAAACVSGSGTVTPGEIAQAGETPTDAPRASAAARGTESPTAASSPSDTPTPMATPAPSDTPVGDVGSTSASPAAAPPTRAPTPTTTTAVPTPASTPVPTPVPAPTRSPDPNAPAIKGQVTDQTGAPYSGVCITIGPPVRCVTTTASDGTYFVSLESAPTGIAWDVRFLVNGVVKVEKLGVIVNGPTVINVTIAR